MCRWEKLVSFAWLLVAFTDKFILPRKIICAQFAVLKVKYCKKINKVHVENFPDVVVIRCWVKQVLLNTFQRITCWCWWWTLKRILEKFSKVSTIFLNKNMKKKQTVRSLLSSCTLQTSLPLSLELKICLFAVEQNILQTFFLVVCTIRLSRTIAQFIWKINIVLKKVAHELTREMKIIKACVCGKSGPKGWIIISTQCVSMETPMTNKKARCRKSDGATKD